MQDRFKFRWYSKVYNGVYEVNSIYLNNEFVNFHLDDFNDITNKICDENGYLIQCTGLKDKNNKPIYEGDILIFQHGNQKRAGFVEVYKTVWSVTNSNFCQGAWCGGALINLYETSEVIGNIYENPELLEVKP